MRTGRRCLLAALAALVCAALVACSAPTSATKDVAGDAAQSVNHASSAYFESAIAPAESYDSGAGYEESSSGAPAALERKIIRDASMVLEADDCAAAYASLLARVQSLGGYESSHDMRTHDDSYSVSATLKVPPDRLDEFLHFAGDVGKVITSSTSSEDITDGYYDSQTRLETKRTALERYYALLEKATTTDEIITIQRTIDNITEDIEALEGRLRRYDALVDFSTISLSIYAPNKAIETVSWNALSVADMGLKIQKGFVGTVNFFWSLLQWLVIVLATLSPLLVIAAIVLFLCRKRIRAWRERRKESARRYREALQPMGLARAGSDAAKADAAGAHAETSAARSEAREETRSEARGDVQSEARGDEATPSDDHDGPTAR